jgi:hypothetical protein
MWKIVIMVVSISEMKTPAGKVSGSYIAPHNANLHHFWSSNARLLKEAAKFIDAFATL